MSNIKEQRKKSILQTPKHIGMIYKKKTDSSKKEHHLLNLQKNMGNQTIQRLINSGFIQTKLTISQPNDRYEQEADNISDKVMQMPESEHKPIGEQITPLIQRESEGETSAVPESLESKINTLQGGEPFSKENRAFFEPRFGQSFSHIKIHRNSHANHLARSINAKAFTRGNNIVFKSGEYNPNTATGKRLLGHELTHVLQQKGTNPLNISRKKDKKEEKVTPKDKAIKATGKATLIMFFKTSIGKKYKKKLLNFSQKPLGMGIPIIAPIPRGIALAGLGSIPILSYMYAKNMNMPQGLVDLIPKFAKIDINKNISLSFQPIFKGKLNKPKEIGGIINFTILNW